MGDADEHKCHCGHVVVLQTKISMVQWFCGIAIVGVLGVAGTLAGQFISNRLSWNAPSVTTGERLFLDRVSRPDAPSESHGR